MDWPSQSPDMNPIENLWQDLKKIVRQHKPTNKEDLKHILNEKWNKICSERCGRLVGSMPSRTTALYTAMQKGMFTKY